MNGVHPGGAIMLTQGILRSTATRLLLLVVLLLSAARSTPAQSTPEAGAWRFRLSPYLLVPYMRGTTGIDTLLSDVDATPADIFDKLQFGGMLQFEANNGTWGIGLDGIYMDLKQDGKPAGEILQDRVSWTVRMQQGAAELDVFRRVGSWMEVLAGARLNTLSSEITVRTVNLGTRSRSLDKTWFDPVVGLRLTVPNTGKWNLSVRGDVGGFGVGSKFAWQVHPKVGYQFTRVFELQAAYRGMGMDYEDESDPVFIYDMKIFGPEFGLVFHF